MGLTPLDRTGRPLQLPELDLGPLFRPRSVAVIGASETPGRPTTRMFQAIRRWADRAGALTIPVNPRYASVDGLPCYPSLRDVPGDVDVASILIGDPLGVIDDVVAKGARFAVVFAAGFAESGPEGEERQRLLLEKIAGSPLRLLGPNTNMNIFESLRDELPGRPLALISQSGHQGRPIYQAQDIGIKLGFWAPTGNEADLEFSDFAGWFAQQPEVGCITAYVEGFKNGRSFALAADRAATNGVPIVLVKVGRTSGGASMAQAHTGHLAGSDAITDGAFRQFGVVRVDGLDELLETSAMFARTNPPKGPGVCVVSISGGTSAHMADMCEGAGLDLAQLGAGTQAKLRAWVDPSLRVSNPVDLGRSPGYEAAKGILDAILADPGIGAVICPVTGVVGQMDDFIRGVVDVGQESGKPVFVVWGSPVGDETAYREILLPSQLPVFRSSGNAVKALRAYFGYHDFRSSYRSPFPQRDEPSAISADARKLIAGPAPVTELGAKSVLSAYGIRVTRDHLVGTAKEAVAAAESLGYPVVVKVSDPHIQHKSDRGLVRVDLRTAAEVGHAARDILERAPGAEGVLVCEMVGGGVETVVGLAQDEVFGPAIMFGLGGIFVEVMRDVAFRVLPFTESDAYRMISELRGAALLDGARTGKPVDRGAIVDTLMKVQELALDLHDEIAELDINPLLARPDGVVALDAVIVRRNYT